MVMENPEQARLVLEKLKDIGLGLALDDFGTGYSSLAYLTRFPFDTIKLDKALVCDTSDRKSTVLPRGHFHGARTGHEGGGGGHRDPTTMQSSWQKWAATYGQSYLFGPPMASRSVLRLLEGALPADEAGVVQALRIFCLELLWRRSSGRRLSPL